MILRTTTKDIPPEDAYKALEEQCIQSKGAGAQIITNAITDDLRLSFTLVAYILVLASR